MREFEENIFLPTLLHTGALIFPVKLPVVTGTGTTPTGNRKIMLILTNW